jgi:pSer/pThr/pTyr-binding forkhead associated (FHA) protein
VAGSGDGGEGHTYSFVNRGASRRTQQSARPKGSLIAVAGEQAGRRYAIGDGVVIGRSDDADVALTDPDVSRAHARVTRIAGDSFIVEDLGSRNGTFVDGRRIGSEILSNMGEVTLGNTTLLFTITLEESIQGE